MVMMMRGKMAPSVDPKEEDEKEKKKTIKSNVTRE